MKKNIFSIFFCALSIPVIAQSVRVDTTFGEKGYAYAKISFVSADAKCAIQQSDGKIIINSINTLDLNNSTKTHSIVRINVDGTTDGTFINSLYFFSPITSSYRYMALTTDDGIIAGGVDIYNNWESPVVAKLDKNGRFDTTFGNNGQVKINLGTKAQVNGILVLPDEKILLYVTSSFMRLNKNGSIDSTFGNNGSVPVIIPSTSFFSLKMQSDNKLILVVKSTTLNSCDVRRYLPNGSIDSTYFGNGKVSVNSIDLKSVCLQPDDKVLLGGSSTPLYFPNKLTFYNPTIVRLTLSGNYDPSFNVNGIKILTSDSCIFNTIALQQDGKIVFSCMANTVNGIKLVKAGVSNEGMYRLNPDGSLDNGFGNNGTVITQLKTQSIQPKFVFPRNNTLLIAGNYYNFEQKTEYYLHRIYLNGSNDLTYDGDGIKTVSLDEWKSCFGGDIGMQSDGKIIIGGNLKTAISTTTMFALSRFHPNGTIDNTFGYCGTQTLDFNKYYNYITSVAIQNDEKIILGGYGEEKTGQGMPPRHIILGRFEKDGTIDSTFGTNGIVDFSGFTGTCQKIVWLPDGKILLGGANFSVLRLNSDGTLDTSFDSDGIASYTVSASNNNNSVNGLAVQPDGKIIAVGNSYDPVSTFSDFAIIRINPNGSLDSGFDGDGIVTVPIGKKSDVAIDVDIQPDGKIIVAGDTKVDTTIKIGCCSSSTWNNAGRLSIVRLNPNGSLDNTFSSDGKIYFFVDNQFGSHWMRKVKALVNGNIIVAGSCTTPNTTGGASQNENIVLAMVDTSGNLYAGFDTNGTYFDMYSFLNTKSMIIKKSGEIIVSATRTPLNSGYSGFFTIAKFLNQDILLHTDKNPNVLSNQLAVYPNPSSGKIKLSFPKETGSIKVTITVYDMLGKKAYSDTYSKEEEIDLSNLREGMYALRIENSILSYTGKFLINK